MLYKDDIFLNLEVFKVILILKMFFDVIVVEINKEVMVNFKLLSLLKDSENWVMILSDIDFKILE